jgi:hypothetical protein
MAKTQSAKFKIKKFSGKNNFEIWKVKMHDLLVQQGMVKVLLGKAKKPATITDEDWDEIDARELSAIHMCLVDDVTIQHCCGEDNSQFMDEAGKLVYDEILNEQDLSEKIIVQFVHEGRYKNS